MPLSSADPAAYVAVGIQSALGTPQTTAAKFRFLKYLSGNNVEAQIDVVDLREGGDGLNFGYTYKKQHKVAGQLVFNARPDTLGQILAAIPGGATWDGASGPALHNFHTGHASHPWMTLQVGHPGTSLVHFLADTRFTGITIEGAGGEPWKVTVPFIAINHGASAVALAPTYGLNVPGGDDPFLYQGGTYIIDGTGDSDITSFKIDIGLGVEELQAVQVTLDEIIVQNRDVNVEWTRRYEDATFWKKVYMGGGVSPTLSVASGGLRVRSSNGLTGVNQRTWLIGADNLSYRGDGLTELDPDGKTIMESVSAKALANGATHSLYMQLSNGHASTYGS